MINIVYTNHRCKDVFKLFKSQHDLNCTLPLFTISDYEGEYIYDENTPYYTHWVNALESIDDEYFIYNQEDFILYDKVDIDKLNFLKQVLELNPQYSFIRLIKSGNNLPEIELSPNLYPIGYNSFPLYSMQATIWRKDKFIQLYNNTQQNKWFECNIYEQACRDLSIEGMYYYNNEPKRGNHYDSSIYPYIATAVVKGKWNITEYTPELSPLFEKYNINPEERGTV